LRVGSTRYFHWQLVIAGIGLSLDVSTVCSVLCGIGLLDVDTDTSSCVLTNKHLSERRREFLNQDVELGEIMDSASTFKRAADVRSVLSGLTHNDKPGDKLIDASGASLLSEELKMIPQDSRATPIYKMLCTVWKTKFESYFENARVLHKLSAVAAAKAAAEAAAVAANASAVSPLYDTQHPIPGLFGGAYNGVHAAANVTAPASVNRVGSVSGKTSAVDNGVSLVNGHVDGEHNDSSAVLVSSLPTVVGDAGDKPSGALLSVGVESGLGGTDSDMNNMNNQLPKFHESRPFNDEFSRDNQQFTAKIPANMDQTTISMRTPSLSGLVSVLAGVVDVSDGHVSNNHSFGPKVVKRASNQRAWKLSSDDLQIFYSPDTVLKDWSQACYAEAAALEIEEALVRRLASQVAVSLKPEPYRVGTSYLTNEYETEAPISNDVSLQDSSEPVVVSAPLQSPPPTNIKDGAVYTAAGLWEKAKRSRNKLKRRNSTGDCGSYTGGYANDEGLPRSYKRTSSFGGAAALTTTAVPVPPNRYSSPLDLRTEVALIDKNPFAKSIFASLPNGSPSHNQLSAFIVKPDLVVKTAPLPWKSVAAEFQELDNEDAENPLFALSFTPRESSRSESRGFRRQNSSSSIGSYADDSSFVSSPHTPLNSPSMLMFGRKSASFGGSTGEKRPRAEGIASGTSSKVKGHGLTRSSSSSSMGSVAKDKKLPLVLAPNFREVTLVS
jgi:hypothetical protein